MQAKSNKSIVPSCPCTPERAYADCCARYHQGQAAPSAEALMRSRYSAYALKLDDYLRATWDPNTLPSDLRDGAMDHGKLRWLRLQVIRSESLSTEHALVEFVAVYQINGTAHKMREISEFRFVNGRWFYVAARAY